jgi:hypothetical protein
VDIVEAKMKVINYIEERWNVPVEVVNPAKPKYIYLKLGVVNENTLAVTETGPGALGGGRLYCIQHKAIYMPTTQCPICVGLEVPELEIQGSVTSCDTP